MGPLHGIRVLDFTRVLAGPFCTMQLADMGADVVKVEEPGKGDDTRGFGPPFIGGESAYFMSVNRGKRSLALNLKDARGIEIARTLAAKADVVAENFRPGVMKRLGLDYEALAASNPRLVYVSISGFGHAGLDAYTHLAGYDVVMQGMSGLQHVTGDPNGPPFKSGISISDLLTGFTACQGVLLALFAREKTGRGQWVDISMQDATVQVLTFLAGNHLNAARSPMRMGNRHPSICPYETFHALDGYVNIAVANDSLFVKFAALIKRPDLSADPRFATNGERVANREALIPLIAEIVGRRTVADWVTALSEAGIPGGPVLDVAQALAHPQLAARQMIASLDHPTAGPVRVLGVPVKLSKTPGEVSRPPPVLGEHTEAILGEIPVDAVRIAQLQADGVVATAGTARRDAPPSS